MTTETKHETGRLTLTATFVFYDDGSVKVLTSDTPRGSIMSIMGEYPSAVEAGGVLGDEFQYRVQSALPLATGLIPRVPKSESDNNDYLDALEGELEGLLASTDRTKARNLGIDLNNKFMRIEVADLTDAQVARLSALARRLLAELYGVDA